MKMLKLQILCGCILLFPLICNASNLNSNSMTPEGVNRTFIENYKDMVLAHCVAKAYKDDENAARDAGSSESALFEWTYFDLEKSPKAVIKIVNTYLSRNYFNPLAEAEVKGIKFDFLKCLDLYHSKELDALARKMISHPQDKVKNNWLKLK